VLVETAWTAIRKDPALAAVFDRIARRAGKRRAIITVAWKLIGKTRAVLCTQARYKVGYRLAA